MEIRKRQVNMSQKTFYNLWEFANPMSESEVNSLPDDTKVEICQHGGPYPSFKSGKLGDCKGEWYQQKIRKAEDGTILVDRGPGAQKVTQEMKDSFKSREEYGTKLAEKFNSIDPKLVAKFKNGSLDNSKDLGTIDFYYNDKQIGYYSLSYNSINLYGVPEKSKFKDISEPQAISIVKENYQKSGKVRDYIEENLPEFPDGIVPKITFGYDGAYDVTLTSSDGAWIGRVYVSMESDGSIKVDGEASNDDFKKTKMKDTSSISGAVSELLSSGPEIIGKYGRKALNKFGIKGKVNLTPANNPKLKT